MPDNIDVVLESEFESHIQENRRILWQGLLAGPVIYALYFITVYLIAEAACYQHFFMGTISGLPLLSVVVLIITLAAAFCTLINGLSNFQRWRQQEERPERPMVEVTEVEYETANPETSVTFMAFGGLLLSMLFTMMILFTGIPTLILEVCTWA